MRNVITANETKSLLGAETKYIFQATNKRTFTAKLHTHTFYEFIYVLSGSCTQLVDGVAHDMKKQDFILLCPGNRHCFLSQATDTSLLCISIAKAEFQKYELLYGDTLRANSTHSVHLTSPTPEALSRLICDMHNPTQNEIRAVCSCIFAGYADAAEPIVAIPAVLQNMSSKMLNDTSLLQSGIKAMMQLTNYSEAQLGRLTKKYYGASPHTYLKNLRLQTAWHYILQTDKALEEISHICGYNCYGYFTTIFKEKYGFSPATLRKTKH